MEDIKDYREKELKSYFIGNILILLFSLKQFNEFFVQALLDNTENGNDPLALLITFLTSAFISPIIYIYLFLFDSLISADFKTVLCNLGRKLPGETIFEKIRYKNIDNRFTKEMVKTKYQDIYSKLDELQGKEKNHYSNEIWYGIYRAHKEEPMIHGANRDYLLCRDFCFSTLCLVLMYLFLVCFGFSIFSIKYLFFLFGEIVCTNIAMQNKAKRFAFNVIAADIQNGE